MSDANARDAARELDWLAAALQARFARYFSVGEGTTEPPPPPAFDPAASPFAALIAEAGLDAAERAVLALALAAQLRPRLLDLFHTRNTATERRFTEFGGVRGAADGEFRPTGETAAFLAGGDDLTARFAVAARLAPGAPLVSRGLLRPPDGDDPLRAELRLTAEALDRATLCTGRGPAFGAGFPAHRIETALAWEDLVLHPATRRQVGELEAWLRHGETLMRDWGMARLLRPGYRALFHGPPGTGKTMTACLLGRATGRDVYRIDLALTVSKFIGETEKNLAAVFDAAEARGWILFFDEADALFGKRSEVKDAHDRYANQEVAYLLQRIERFDGVVILASNLRDNIDDAFARRFESIVYFPMPRAEERQLLWRQGMPARARLADDLDLAEIARDHALSGGGIINAVRYAAIAALADGERPIAREHLLHAIRRELAKEGRPA